MATTLSRMHRSRHAADDRIEVGARLDSASSRSFGRRVARLVRSGLRSFVFDLGNTTSVDSSGFGSLIAAIRKVEEAGGAVAVACSDATLRRLFEIAGITKLVAVADDYESARATLRRVEHAAVA